MSSLILRIYEKRGHNEKINPAEFALEEGFTLTGIFGLTDYGQYYFDVKPNGDVDFKRIRKIMEKNYSTISSIVQYKHNK